MDRISETNRISSPTKRTKYLRLLYGVLISAFVFLFAGPLFSRFDPLWGIVLTEIVAIALPAQFYRRHMPKVDRSAMSLKEAALFTLALFPAILVLNGLFLTALSRFFVLENQSLDMLQGAVPLWKQILTLAIFPAIMEETFFRGVLCEEFSARSPLGSVFFTAFIFALFHFQWQNSVAPFLFGLVLGYIYWYGGLKASIFSHILYNLSSIFFVRLFSDAWTVKLAELSLVRRMGGLTRAITLLLLIGSAIGVMMILRKSLKRPLPKGRAVVRNKEWIPVILFVLVYVVKIIV